MNWQRVCYNRHLSYKNHLTAYASRVFNKHEQSYVLVELEALAVDFAIKNILCLYRR